MALKRLLTLLRFTEDDDRDWQQQNVGESPLYEYIHLQDRGKLVQAFDRKSSIEQRTAELNGIIHSEIVQFLYDGGKGRVVASERNSFAPQINVSVEVCHT